MYIAWQIKKNRVEASAIFIQIFKNKFLAPT